MKYLSFLIKPASSLCNLKCTYCFYNDVSKNRKLQSYGIMGENIMKKLIDRAFEAIDDDGVLTFAFQGGEPILAGIAYYQRFVEYVAQKKTKQRIYYALQTNGTLLNDEWGDFFNRNQFLVGVSLDGYEANTNRFRVDKNGKGMYDAIMHGISVLKRCGVEFNVLSVITKRLAKHPSGFYHFVKGQNFKYIQCIPCLGELKKDTAQQLRPQEYASFFKELYKLWLEDYLNGEYMSISLFDNILLMLKDRPPQQCGMLGFCSMQFVVEGDGSVYPCDFYVLDNYCCGNILENRVDEIVESKEMRAFLQEKKKSYEICRTCPFARLCHGGCKRQNGAYLSDNLCGYREFLTYAYPTMMQIAGRLP